MYLKSIKIKNTLLFLLIFINSFEIISQYNYFKFTNNLLGPSLPTSSGNDVLLAPNSNLFYRSNYGHICSVYFAYGNWQYNVIWTSAYPKVTSSFVWGDNKLFYVDEQNRIRELRYYNGQWFNDVLNYYAPQARGEALVFVGNSTLYYASTTGDIIKLFYNGSSWQYINTGAIKAKANSVFAFGDNKLIYTDINSRLRQFTYTDPYTFLNLELNISSPASRGDGLVFGESSNIYYTTNSGQIANIYFESTSQSWMYNVVWEATPKYGSKLLFENYNIYYVANDNYLYVLKYDRCKWMIKKINDVATPNPRALFYGDNKIFFQDVSNGQIRESKSLFYLNPSVYLKGKSFINSSNHQVFYPVVMNYQINIRKYNNEALWISPHASYYTPQSNPDFTDSTSANAQLLTHFTIIKNLGFNTVRFGVTIECENNDNATFKFRLNHNATDFTLANLSNYKPEIFNALKRTIDIAGQAGLKVILLSGHGFLQRPSLAYNYGDYLGELADYFKNSTSLMAYDVYNEPDLQVRVTGNSKASICQQTKYWYDKIRQSDKNHLVTIGLFSEEGVEYYDPSLISVDFISYHLWDFISQIAKNKLNIQAKMRWIKDNVEKPWIIGETGFSAITPGDCATNGQIGIGSEEDQRDFADYTQNYTIGCGGSGYSWWAYHDVYHDLNPVSENFQGVFSRCHRLKPVGYEFNKNWNSFSCDNCPKDNNTYYSYNKLAPIKLTGFVLGYPGFSPIKDALIYAFDNNYNVVAKTYTKQDGSYELCSYNSIYRLNFHAISKNSYEIHTSSNTNAILTTFNSCNPSNNLKSIGESNKNESLNDSINLFDLTRQSDFIVYPNPANDALTINSFSSFNKIQIYNSLGILLLDKETNTDTTYRDKIQISELVQGFYTIVLSHQNKKMIKKFSIVR